MSAQIEELTRGLGEVLHVTERKLAIALLVTLALKVKSPGCWKRLFTSTLLLAVKAEGEAVVAELYVQVVTQGVVGASEVSLRIAADGEETGHEHLVDLLERRLPDIDTEIATSMLPGSGPRFEFSS